MEILHLKDLGDTVSLGCERDCSSALKVSIETYLYFKINPLNIFKVGALTVSWSTGGPRGADVVAAMIKP